MDHKRIGRYTTVAVTTSGGILLTANAHRRFLKLSNPSANAIYVSFTGSATVSQDYRISTSQASESFDYNDIGPLITGDIYAIAMTANGFLAIIEGFAVPEPGSGTVGTAQAQFGMS